MQINRSISYTQSWKSTIFIGLIMSAVFCFVLVFLQPFDTYNVEMPYKNIKLIGYCIPIMVSLILIHVFENIWFKKQQKWMLWNEVFVMLIGLLLITFLSFIYLNQVVNTEALPLSEFFPWLKVFGLPFAPLMLMLWIYLRFRFSSVELKETLQKENRSYSITGENANESYHIQWNRFLIARAQSNYVEVWILEEDQNTAEKILLRSSLSKLISQLPEAVQVHRSYLINTVHLIKLEGNSRKGWCQIKHIEEGVPVSPKHFKALKELLQSRPK